jgi:hypothetical protein
MFGISTDDAQEWLDGSEIDEDCLVEEDNWKTLEVFLAMATQWRIIAGMSDATYQGLEYSTIPSVLAMTGIAQADHAHIFHGLRVMESAALSILNKREK